MHWQRWVAALFVVLALAGCAQGTAGQAGAPYAPIRPRTTGLGPSTAEGMVVAMAAVCSWRAVWNSGGAPQSGQAAQGSGDRLSPALGAGLAHGTLGSPRVSG
jgi:hypothetical protein